MRRSTFGLLFTLSVLALALVPLLGSGDATVSANGRDLCISINGNTVVDKDGGAECLSSESDDARPNIARAYDGGFAIASLGSGNTATATGDGSIALAGGGSGNTAIATGEDSFAEATFGNNSTAIVNGDGSTAIAKHGDNNTAKATGDGSTAIANPGNNNIATATGDGSTAFAYEGDNNIATATGDCSARAIGGDQTVSCVGP